MSSPTSNPWRISLQAWVALLGLGLALWLIITHWGLLVEIAIVLFFVALFSMALRPAVNYLTRRRVPAAITLLVIYAAMAQKHRINHYRISRSGMRYGALSWRAGKRVLVELPPD